jgi:hypothetical protein
MRRHALQQTQIRLTNPAAVMHQILAAFCYLVAKIRQANVSTKAINTSIFLY